MPGSWEYQPYITPYDYYVFYSSVENLQEYFYYPVAVATQIVNGTNYRFVAVAEPRSPELTAHFVIVEIYQPIGEQPYVTGITPV